ncbi:hypothetical protein F5Y08DRAFT_313116 [Xylaria arbuscula]|nr:hypothetical protein F5Y08DRAFT_313116 [Xylaria arbuscula]
MAPTILVVGATGNTGQSVVETLSKLLRQGSALADHRIVALTRSSKNPVAQKLAQLPGVEVKEQNWMEISADWLRENEVVRAFVASPSQASQFAEESNFLVAALHAGVKYVVRISTTYPTVRPDAIPFHSRSHWAIEALLGTPEFEGLQWTSLQPNSFGPIYLQTAADFIKQYRSTGQQGTLKLVGSADAPVALIDPSDIGVLAAHLLAQPDPSPHNKAKYVVNGPEDISGNQIVELVEQYIGTKVENVVFKDLSWVDAIANYSPGPKQLTLSFKAFPEYQWQGLCSTATSSKEVLELAPPTWTPAAVLKRMLDE